MKVKKNPRRSFILTSVSIAAATVITGWFGYRSKKKETVKMLTEGGQLVEIDKKLLALTGKRITNEELQGWIKNKTATHKKN